MDIMTKTEFENLIACEIDDYWFEKISKIYDTFEDITDGDLSEIWQNSSLCVMENLYESACKVKDSLDFEIIKLRKEKFCNRIETSKAECATIACLAKIEELETQLQQYKAFALDVRDYIGKYEVFVHLNLLMENYGI